jgi:hypothetical protein
VNFSFRPSLGKILFVSYILICGQGDIPSDNLNLVTVGCSFVLPVHEDCCCSESSCQMHGCVLSTDTLLISLCRVAVCGDIPCEDHFPKRGSFAVYSLPKALIHPHSSTIALA